MQLSAYLSLIGQSPEAFARRAGVHRTRVYRWLHRGERPRASTMLHIQQLTDGAVMPADWFGEATVRSETTGVLSNSATETAQ